MQIIDGGTMAFAAYHALKGKVKHPLTHQMPLMLLKILNESDDTLVVCWDGEALWKRDFWSSYRDRPEIWEEAALYDFNNMFKVLNSIGIVQFRQDTIEADELVAVLVHALDGSEPLLIRSDDKDFMQLLSPTTWMHGRVRGVVGPEQVPGILNVDVDHVVDYLALTGDKVDGIPQVASEAETLRVIHRHGHIKDWLYARNPDAELVRLIDRGRDQLEINVRLVDLGEDNLDFELKPAIEGFGDVDIARKLGKSLNIEHLIDSTCDDVLEAGVRSMERLLEAGVVA